MRNGRRQEFADAYAKHGGEIPDPLVRATFEAARIGWEARAKPEHANRLALTRALLAARKESIVPLLPAMTGAGEVRFADRLLTARWPAGSKALLLLANLSKDTAPRPQNLVWGIPVWGEAPPEEIPPWSVYAAIGG